MNLTDHRRRVDRLLCGERHVTDLDRLFADLRFTGSDLMTVREVGDFAAHRGERDKGIVMMRAADMQISSGGWVRQMIGQMPSLEEARRVGKANLRIAPDERIKTALGMTRQQAETHFLKAAKWLAEGKKPRDSQAAAFNWLATSFIWETAFTDEMLMNDFTNVLIRVGALDEENRERFGECRPFVTLYALTVMHMSHILMPDGSKAPLRLMIREETGTLRIKASIPAANIGKPVSSAVTVFETSLDAATYSGVRAESWDFDSEVPIEIGTNGKIVEIL